MAGNSLASLPRRLHDLREDFREASRRDVPGVLAARTYADAVAAAMGKAVEEPTAERGNWALVAVGGFGRGELSFLSDLDLLFLYHRKLPGFLSPLVRDFTYGLWDAGFEIGHQVSSVSSVARLMRENFSAMTTHLETRFIAGDRPFYEVWRREVLGGFGPQGRRRFLRDLLANREGRLGHYGDSAYLLEPHLKEGVGGLRDLHAIAWAGMVHFGTSTPAALRERGGLTAEEALWVEQAADFLWRVRLQLHEVAGRRQDQLLFPEQEALAGRLGFLATEQFAAVESFMRRYYRETARVRRAATFLLERLEEEGRRGGLRRLRKRILPGPFLLEGVHIRFLQPDLVERDPSLIMQFFRQAAKARAHFHHDAGRVIRENLGAVTDSHRRDPKTVTRFFEILLDPEQSFPVLKVMLETGYLQTFIPEFSAVRYRTQHDVYHLYTVDNHLLRTVRELHRMEHEEGPLGRPPYRDIFAGVAHRRVLFLAALIHDIGKGRGHDHAARGAVMAGEVAARLGLSPDEADLLVHAVRNHLLLPETAQKRDLTDEKPVSAVAVEIGDPERLRILYLLAVADSRATGPGAWNTWKASLLSELFSKAERLHRREDWKAEDIRDRTAEVRSLAAALLPDPGEVSRLNAWLETVSYRYLLSQGAPAVLSHFAMERTLSGRPLVFSAIRAEGDMWELTVATSDRPGLFALITGVLFAHGLNILSADIFTRATGVALDVFRIERTPDPLHTAELWKAVESDLAASLEDRAHLDRLLSRRVRPSLLDRKGLPRKEDKIVISEDASDFYTVIEVYTWDRPGVLHAVSNTFFHLGVSIQLAKITTPGAQVADVFYVTDLEGEKLEDASLHAGVRKELLACLSEV